MDKMKNSNNECERKHVHNIMIAPFLKYYLENEKHEKMKS